MTPCLKGATVGFSVSQWSNVTLFVYWLNRRCAFPVINGRIKCERPKQDTVSLSLPIITHFAVITNLAPSGSLRLLSRRVRCTNGEQLLEGTVASWSLQSARFGERRVCCIMHGGCYFHHAVLSGVIVVPAASAQIAVVFRLLFCLYLNPLPHLSRLFFLL